MAVSTLVWEPAVRWPRMPSPMAMGVPAEPDEPARTDTASPPQPATTEATSDPDVALMLRVQAGDQQAFQELFQKLAPRILRYATRMVENAARAEELTQDVFVQVFRFRARYRPESRLATWIFTIATNLCLNELRRPERRLKVDLWGGREGDERDDGPQLPDPDAVTPEEGARARQLAQRLEAEVAALPPKQRAALTLSRVDGLAYEDVARALGTTEGAIKALIFRATQHLKQRLKDFL
jgi:RNA polymerase sigma-70 factor (ECF subfamily)